MKKYLQIIIVLGVFGLLVLFRQLKGNDQQITQIPTPNPRQNIPLSGVSNYKDGTYTGPVTDAFYGNVQVKVNINGGKITDVQFLQYPNDNPTTRRINEEAMPLLRQEAIQAQSTQIDIVTSASQTSNAFIQSLSSALQQATIM